MINPLRDYWERRRFRVDRGEKRVREHAGRGVDHCCTYACAPGEEWSFDGQAVCLNGTDVETCLERGEEEVATWCGLIDGLAEYQEWARVHRAPQLERLAHVIAGLQERALGQLRRIYEEKVGGMAIRWGDGQVLLNNVNIRAMLAMYHVRPTTKARRFLEGLRHKLALILCDQTISPHLARAQRAVQDIYHDLCASLAHPPVDQLCLPAGGGHPPRNGCR